MKNRPVIPFALLLVLTMVGMGAAHSVHVFAIVENGQISGEGSLSGGNAVKNGVITILADDGEQVLYSGKTDQDGRFSVPMEQLDLPEPINLVVRLDAGPGHRSQWQIKAEELIEASDQNSISGTKMEESAGTDRMAAYPPIKNIITGVICIIGLGLLIAWSRKKGGKR
jgi:nickel transport protein